MARDRSHDICVVGLGARTPVGLQAKTAAAAVRAGCMVALRAHPFMIDQVGEPMPSAMDGLLDPRVFGNTRLREMLQTTLHEACLPLEGLRRYVSSLPLFLGLPQLRPGFCREDVLELQAGLVAPPKAQTSVPASHLTMPLGPVEVYAQGHAAGLQALAQAVAYLQRGATELCLVGGVDSYFHPDTMEWLDNNRQLVGSVSRSGFVPGEAAGVCLLASSRTCQRYGLKPLARIRSVALGDEPKRIKTEAMCLGEGLSATIRPAVEGLTLPQERIDDVFCDINGELYRSEEWGFVCLRLAHYFEDATSYRSPAEFWGDVGAASGPLGLVLACQAYARGYAKGPRAMVWASSEAGLRGAAVVEAPGNA